MDEHEDRKKILHAIVSLASSLGLELVAEGIETESQARHLRGLGCEYGQGYHLGRPVPAAAMEQLLLRAGNAPPHHEPATASASSPARAEG